MRALLTFTYETKLTRRTTYINLKLLIRGFVPRIISLFNLVQSKETGNCLLPTWIPSRIHEHCIIAWNLAKTAILTQF